MEQQNRKDAASAPEQAQYEAPKVEQVIGADEIARQVHYAGEDVPVVSFSRIP